MGHSPKPTAGITDWDRANLTPEQCDMIANAYSIWQYGVQCKDQKIIDLANAKMAEIRAAATPSGSSGSGNYDKYGNAYAAANSGGVTSNKGTNTPNTSPLNALWDIVDDINENKNSFGIRSAILDNGEIWHSVRDIFEFLRDIFGYDAEINWDAETKTVEVKITYKNKTLKIKYDIDDVDKDKNGMGKTSIIKGRVTLYNNGKAYLGGDIKILYEYDVTYVSLSALMSWAKYPFPLDVIEENWANYATLGAEELRDYIRNGRAFDSELDAVYYFGVAYHQYYLDNEIEYGAAVQRYKGAFYLDVKKGEDDGRSVNLTDVTFRNTVALVHTHWDPYGNLSFTDGSPNDYKAFNWYNTAIYPNIWNTYLVNRKGEVIRAHRYYEWNQNGKKTLKYTKVYEREVESGTYEPIFVIPQ